MAAVSADGGWPAPIDRPILEYLEERLRTTAQVNRTRLSDASGHLQLEVALDPAYYPDPVEEVLVTIRWYRNDDFSIHYREVYPDRRWECRWDRHPNAHNSRDHFHPPPGAGLPAEDSAWPDEYRDVLGLVLEEVEARISALWGE